MKQLQNENNVSGLWPTGHRVLVAPDKIKEKSKGGIIYANATIDLERAQAIRGVIIEVGPTAWQEFAEGKPWAKAGDRVICQMRYGIELKGQDGEDYVLFNDEDILAILNSGYDRD